MGRKADSVGSTWGMRNDLGVGNSGIDHYGKGEYLRSEAFKWFLEVIYMHMN